MFSDSQIKKGEANELAKAELVTPFLKNPPKYLNGFFSEMNDILTKCPKYWDASIDLHNVKIDMLFCRLAYGFVPSEYVAFALDGKSAAERRCFCSDTDTHTFGYSVNHIVEVQSFLDKAKCATKFLHLFKRDILILDPKTSIEDFKGFIKAHPRFVKKKIFSSMGKGVEVVDACDIDIDRYFHQLQQSGTWLLEEVVVQSDKMASLHPASVNTIRCITFKTYDGVEAPYCFMRTGSKGAFVDNGGSGGILIGIDAQSGVAVTDGFNEYGEQFECHPDTQIKFRGFEIPDWNDLINICTTDAQKHDRMGYLSWDMAHTNKGWVVIEVNEVGQFIGPQMVFKKGIKPELEHYLTKIEKVI